MIDFSIMSKAQIDWLNDYHKKCWEKVSPFLKNEKYVLDWLEEATSNVKN